MFKLKGHLQVIKETVQITEKFTKREFVVVDEGSMYPQSILFQAVQDKCSMLDEYKEGQQVEVSFNLRGREWTSPQGEVKYFNTLEAWRIEAVDGSSQSHTPVNQAAIEPIGNEEDDDLPF